ncbi:hypothetical protein BO85DRAFT_81790 [Aspergillus piperis CBS 112811]|uniref:Uncharacterized protein n=1 Tax=Aspergillus piperis CBS 112811 TaxID=1448313 RepID=A0A8G1QZ26_9EURO|nr:hypothetical protein BO85DRAFT_81790 [Aspergillus piperis CBS 112811]RAH55244.1 hypothetical protein BO85DRAFT_81790 [Aspergillus piperis CBS 112811]
MATVTFKDDLPNTTTTTTPKNKTTTLRRWLTFSTSTSSSHRRRRRSSSPRPKPTRRPTPKPTINTTTSTSTSTSTTTRLYRRVTLPRRSSKSKTKTRTIIHPDDDTQPTSLLTSINTTTNTGTPTAHPTDTTNPITPPPTSPTSPSSTTNNKIRARSPLSPLSPLSLNFSTLFNLSPRSKTIEESSSSSSTYSSSSASEIHIPPPTVSHEQLTSSYAEYCEAFTEGRTEESFLYQEEKEGEEYGDKGVRPVKEIVIKGEKGCLEERCRGKEGVGGGGQCVVDTKEEETKENGDGDRAIPCSDDQREILHWLRESDEEEQDSGSNAEDVPLRVSPPARILTPARYEQSRRAARQPQHGKQEHHEDQRHAWWTALRVGWTRMRRRTSRAANPDYN